MQLIRFADVKYDKDFWAKSGEEKMFGTCKDMKHKKEKSQIIVSPLWNFWFTGDLERNIVKRINEENVFFYFMEKESLVNHDILFYYFIMLDMMIED